MCVFILDRISKLMLKKEAVYNVQKMPCTLPVLFYLANAQSIFC